MGAPLPGDGYAAVCEAWAAGFTPPARVTVSEWADQYRYLPSKGASEPGRWRTERTPYLREIMDALSAHSPVRRVSFMKCTQVGGTEALNNWIAYIVAQAPAPAMVVQPTVEVAERWSKQRFAAMIEETPVLRERIAPSRSRDSGNTTLLKEFPGGLVVVTGSNSPAGLRSMPVKFLAMDEIDAYEADVGDEGNPIDLAERRTTTFPRRKIFLCSTPTIAGVSNIEREYLASDQRRYHLPCPHCAEQFVLRWPLLRWDAALTRAWIVCPSCGSEIEETHKTSMLAAGEWVAKYPTRDARGYHINALYTPIGLGDTWLDHAKGYLAKKDNPVALKTWTNTVLGETWSDNSDNITPAALMEQAEAYPLRTVPRGVLVITAGVDTQPDRLAVQIVGWGRDEESWVLDYVELPGNPATPELWQTLDTLLAAPLTNEAGITMPIELAALDTGGANTHEAYNYVRNRRDQRVLAIKGASVANRPIIARSNKIDLNRQGKAVAGGLKLWMVGTDTAKAALMARLAAQCEREDGHRFVHFSAGLDSEYYAQLLAEVYDPTKAKWVKRRKRNEALDTYVYAYAAACHPHVRVHARRAADWESLERTWWPPSGDLFAQPVVPPPDAITQPPRPADDGAFSHPPADDWLGGLEINF